MKYTVIFRKQFNVAGEGTDYPTDFLLVPEGVIEDMTFIEMRPPVPAQSIAEAGEHRCMCGCGCVAPLPANVLICAGCLASEDEAHETSLYGEEEWQYEVNEDRSGSFEFAVDRCETALRYSEIAA